MNFLIGRQQIYDRDWNVYGYELLFRNFQGDSPVIVDGTQATNQIIVDSMLEHGLENLVGFHYAFINFTRDNILSGTPLLLPKDRVIIEVLESVEVDEPLIEALHALAKQGYRIALDDFIFSEEKKPLVNLAHIIKLDVQHLSREQNLMHFGLLQRFPVKILAEKVETAAQFYEFKKLGCDYFQGFFFSKPCLVSGERLAANDYVLFSVLAEINKPNINTQALAKIISSDVGLSYKLLRYINSAYFSLPRKIISIHHGILYLGIREIRRWANLIILLRLPNASKELIRIALVRAKMCELLCIVAGNHNCNNGCGNDCNCEKFFLVGLLSIINQMLKMPLDKVASSLPLAEDVFNGLAYREGAIGEALNCAINYEHWNLSAVHYLNLSPFDIGKIFLDSVAWAMEINLSLR
ncbi:EAL domain protein [Nitrosococcus halophilus Nc 4]|uniref:EAL domain protein n=1 Tax=Nitrosococcus halophilus (strain Nc4) TaxID=472759 RepID=D5BV73_NITHN|nr:HDOD domain-containing protein [Nitrosococcus halophilus]ADE15423.1 EAL domain protein [Nitrosococcus halophilus Nc 4]